MYSASGPGSCAALAWAVPLSPIDLTHLNILRTEAWSGPGASEQPASACGKLVHGREAVEEGPGVGHEEGQGGPHVPGVPENRQGGQDA